MASFARSRCPSAYSETSFGTVSVKLLYPALARRSYGTHSHSNRATSSPSSPERPASTPNPISGTRPRSRSVLRPGSCRPTYASASPAAGAPPEALVMYTTASRAVHSGSIRATYSSSSLDISGFPPLIMRPGDVRHRLPRRPPSPRVGPSSSSLHVVDAPLLGRDPRQRHPDRPRSLALCRDPFRPVTHTDSFEVMGRKVSGQGTRFGGGGMDIILPGRRRPGSNPRRKRGEAAVT